MNFLFAPFNLNKEPNISKNARGRLEMAFNVRKLKNFRGVESRSVSPVTINNPVQNNQFVPKLLSINGRESKFAPIETALQRNNTPKSKTRGRKASWRTLSKK